jgi:chromosome partitioning protein
MKTVVVAAPKGGAGKTTITSILAARAARDGKVAMFDLNADQGNLGHWWTARGEPENPRLIVDIKKIPQDVKALEAGGYDWLIVDTPPLDMDVIEQAVVVANAVVLPVRCSMFDVAVIDAVLEMCKRHRTPCAFVLSAVDSRMSKLTDQTLRALASEGTVLASRISYRQPYIQALSIGKSGAEIDKGLEPEVDALWAELKLLAGGRT